MVNRKDTNIQTGRRLWEARTNMYNIKAEFSVALDVTKEHFC